MPVFFIHDPAKGIVTPLDRRFNIRDIPPATELTPSAGIHPTTDGDGKQEQPPARRAAINREATQAYAETKEAAPEELGVVRDIMTHPVLSISIDKNLAEAWELMKRYEIHHLVVVNEQHKLCGMLSTDTMLEYLMETDPRPASEIDIADLCGKKVLSTSPDTGITEFAIAMLERGLDGVPVTEHSKLVGIVTYADVLKVILQQRHLAINA